LDKSYLDVEDIPEYASKLPFILDINGTEFKMYFLGGFSGVVEDNNNFSPQLSAGLAFQDP